MQDYRGDKFGVGMDAIFFFPSGIVYSRLTKLFYIICEDTIKTLTLDESVGETLRSYKSPLKSIAIDKTGNIYVASKQGIAHIHSTTGEMTLVPNTKASGISFMAFNSKGDLFAASTSELYMIKRSLLPSYSEPITSPINTSHLVSKERKGNKRFCRLYFNWSHKICRRLDDDDELKKILLDSLLSTFEPNKNIGDLNKEEFESIFMDNRDFIEMVAPHWRSLAFRFDNIIGESTISELMNTPMPDTERLKVIIYRLRCSTANISLATLITNVKKTVFWMWIKTTRKNEARFEVYI